MLKSVNLNVKNFFQIKENLQDLEIFQSRHRNISSNIDNETFRYLGTDKCSLVDYMKYMQPLGWTLSKHSRSTISFTSSLNKLNIPCPKGRKVLSYNLKIFGQDVNQDDCEMKVSYFRKKKKTTYTYCHQFTRDARGFELNFEFIKDSLFSSFKNPVLKRFPLPPSINPHKDPRIEYNDKTKFIRLTFFK